MTRLRPRGYAGQVRRLALPGLMALGLSACGLQDFCVNIGSGCPAARPQEAPANPVSPGASPRRAGEPQEEGSAP